MVKLDALFSGSSLTGNILSTRIYIAAAAAAAVVVVVVVVVVVEGSLVPLMCKTRPEEHYAVNH